MERNIFSPKLSGLSADVLSAFFLRAAQWVMGLTLGLLPLWFLPQAGVSLGFTKVVFVVGGVYIALILACLSLLRSGKVSLYRPPLIATFWLYTAAICIGALLSGDTFDALFGVSFDVQTGYFTLLMAMVMSLSLVYVGAKKAITRSLFIFGVTLVCVYVYSLLRFFLGADFLSFGVFDSNFVTVLGGLNDLALYAGLCLIMILVSVHTLPSNTILRVTVSLLSVASLLILAVVNFAFVWVVIGMLSLLTFLYLVAKDTWLRSDTASAPVSRFTLGLVAFVCVISGAFVVSGDYLGAKMSNLTGISYLEVRPSFTATLEIGKSVYGDNAFVGVGPNRFEDAWRLYKDSAINETQFWNTNFVSGNSYALTILATTGIFGAVFFIIFILWFLYTGYRLVFTDRASEDGWSLLGTLTFAAASYLWLMCFWYTPGATILLLTAFFTGLMVAVNESRRSEPVRVLNVAYSRQYGFLLIATSVVLIVSATGALIKTNGMYGAESRLASDIVALAGSDNVAGFDEALQRVAASLPEQDTYVAERARLRLTELNRLFSLTEPTEEDRQRFESLLVEGVRLAESAIVLDRTNPFNYALLASFYGLLNPDQFEGISERRDEALATARQLDPTNPEYRLLSAQMALRQGDVTSARNELQEALTLKNNLTDALFLLSQLDIQEGNATSAIATTRSIITLEPYNPGRRYQLGLLLLATQSLEEAAQAFTEAVTLDQNYANARYMLALTYLDLGRADEALEQLKIVALTNEDNAALTALIAQLETGEIPQVEPAPVAEAETVESRDQTVTSTPPDTDLVTPVNRLQQSEEIPTEVESTETE